MLCKCSRMKTKSQLRASIIALMVVSQVSLAIPPDSNPFSEIYVMAGNPATTMNVRREGNQYQIELSGGDDGLSGASTVADCFIHAEGKRAGNRLAAAFTALETDTFSYSEREARAENRKLEVIFEPEGATVVHADTLGYCGLGATFEGQYRPKSAK